MTCLSNDLIIGADLALNHGALVGSDGSILHVYKQGKGLISTVDELWEMALLLSSYVPLGANVAVDWDRNIGSFGSNSKTATLMTVLIIHFIDILRMQNHSRCTLVAPSQIRAMLKLPLTCKKEVVHNKVTFPENINAWKCRKDKVSLPYRAAEPKEIKGDVKDAYILARYLKRTLNG